MKKRITVVLEVESKHEEELKEKLIKENLLYELNSVPISANIVSYKEEVLESTEKAGGCINENDVNKHYWQHPDADYNYMIPLNELTRQ